MGPRARTTLRTHLRAATLAACATLPSSAALAADWTSWRGPTQMGTSSEADLVAPLDPEAHLLWSHDVSARGTPVIAGDRVYLFGYRGRGPDVAEVLVAFDLASGEVLWERRFRDFLSDIIYDRYSIGAPTVDPRTGHVYVQSSNGVLMAFTAEGKKLWEVSMMEALGRLSFPNGRTGAPVIDRDLVIVHGITANWGSEGPARDRFYAFDKKTGELVWRSTPGTGPKDSSFSTPVFEDRGGRRLLYAGTGCGHVVAVDARTGAPVWRQKMSIGGVNVSPVIVGDVLVASHAKENLDSTEIGRTIGIDLTATPTPSDEGGAPVLDGELWRLPLAGFSSSPVAHDGVVYQVSPTGELWAVEAATGKVHWATPLGPDQLHASPVWADGRLWVPLRDGSLSVVKGGRDGGRVLQKLQLEGTALGAPAVADGRILVTTTDKLYVFGEARPITPLPEPGRPTPGTPPPAEVRVRPAEVRLTPGSSVALTVDLLGQDGIPLSNHPAASAQTFIPPTAKVKAEMDATFEDGALVAAADAELSAGAWKVSAKGLTGTTRGRVIVGVPYAEDFDDTALDETSDAGPFAYPPLPWIGARFKWEVREVDGDPALRKTLTNMIFQRSTVFVGDPDASGYTLSASMKTDGDRRSMSTMGLVNQRYLIALKGNQRVLEISSNQERLKESVPFAIAPGVWYRLKTQVVAQDDGSSLVRAKAWAVVDDEPADWTVEVRHPEGHTHGAPGLFGFSPRNLHAVYLDDIAITPLDDAEAK